MLVQIIGAASATPTATHNPTAQLLSVENEHYLLDCGEGTQKRMMQLAWSISKIDAIFITHLHGDHVLGLIGLLTTFELYGRSNTLQLFGPKGIKAFVMANLVLMKNNTAFFDTALNKIDIDLYYKLVITELEHTEPQKCIFETDKVQVSCFPLYHRVPCVGYRFDKKTTGRKFLIEKAQILGLETQQFKILKNGTSVINSKGETIEPSMVLGEEAPVKSYAFCTDTIYNSKITKHISNVDMLYHEATYLTQDIDKAKAYFHATAAQAAHTALEANAKRLLIGHFSSRYKDYSLLLKEAQAVFENTEIALEGASFNI